MNSNPRQEPIVALEGRHLAIAAPVGAKDHLGHLASVGLTLPIGVIVFLGSGITDNLAGKARGLGIPAWRFRRRGVSDVPKGAGADHRSSQAPLRHDELRTLSEHQGGGRPAAGLWARVRRCDGDET